MQQFAKSQKNWLSRAARRGWTATRWSVMTRRQCSLACAAGLLLILGLFLIGSAGMGQPPGKAEEKFAAQLSEHVVVDVARDERFPAIKAIVPPRVSVSLRLSLGGPGQPPAVENVKVEFADPSQE